MASEVRQFETLTGARSGNQWPISNQRLEWNLAGKRVLHWSIDWNQGSTLMFGGVSSLVVRARSYALDPYAPVCSHDPHGWPP